MLNNKLKLILAGLASAGLLTLLAGLGVLKQADLAASDALYQQRAASDGQIVLVDIDQRALEVFGPYDRWGRDVIASAIDALNQSEECRPAVIGIDVLFTGETQPELDQQLAEAAGRYGNVVTACAAEFGTDLVEDSGEYYLDRFSLLAFEQPFDSLLQVTTQGHINAMLDSDGILRHHMLAITLPDGTQVPSLALAAADLYRAWQGREPVERPPTDSRGFWYVPFCGLPGDLDHSISVADVIDGTFPAEYFAGKIVLIGPYASGLRDSYLTSIDHARPMYGVEFQANAIQALLWGEYRMEAGDGFQLVILFLLLLAGLATFWQRPVRLSTAVWLLIAGGWLLVCLGVSRLGWLLHVLWVPVGITILYGGCLAFNYIQAALERKQVIDAFKRYVSPEIVDELSRNWREISTEGHSAEIAVLFVDIRGFTKLSEKLAPKELVKYLNLYLGTISQCIWNNNGTVDKFVGDEVMAFWGAPLEQKDPALNAARAAVEMVAAMDDLSQKLNKQFHQPIAYGVGIHLGNAVVGNVGCDRRMDYTAIGDTVNVAARLQSITDGGIIYISRAMVDALGERADAECLPKQVSLKNKSAPMEVWKLKGLFPE